MKITKYKWLRKLDHGAANRQVEMNYNKLFYNGLIMESYYEGGFDCIESLISLQDISSKSCTYRPSLSSISEISRNIVGVLESAPRITKV